MSQAKSNFNELDFQDIDFDKLQNEFDNADEIKEEHIVIGNHGFKRLAQRIYMRKQMLGSENKDVREEVKAEIKRAVAESIKLNGYYYEANRDVDVFIQGEMFKVCYTMTTHISGGNKIAIIKTIKMPASIYSNAYSDQAIKKKKY